jgi:hypothetical protein
VSYGAEKICFLYANQDSTILRAPAASRFEEAGLEGCCENGEFAGGWFGVGDELGNPGCKVLTDGGAWVGGAEAGTDGPAKAPKARNAATIGSTGFVEPDIEAL